MPNKTIFQLPYFNSPAGDNLFPLWVSGVTKSFPLSGLTNYINAFSSFTVNQLTNYINSLSGLSATTTVIPVTQIAYGSGSGVTSDINFRRIGSNIILSGDSSRITVTGNTGAATIGVASNHSGYLHVTNSGGSNVFIVDSTTGHVSVGPVLTANTDFHVMGTIKLVTGNEGTAKVLTSDSVGNADWQTLPIITGISSTPIVLASGATINWDARRGTNASVRLGSNSTLAVTNSLSGSYGTLVVTQDAVGGRTLNLPVGSKAINGGAGVLPLSSGATLSDVLTFYYDGVTYWWNMGKNYS